jgi:hypothetical protein
MAGGKVARFLFVTLRERLICSLSCEKKVSNDSIVGRRRGEETTTGTVQLTMTGKWAKIILIPNFDA